MSEYSIYLIPTDPFFRPTKAAVQTALARLEAYFDRHEGMWHYLGEDFTFSSAGDDFERVICKRCHSKIFDWFIQDVLGPEMVTIEKNQVVTFPCCGAKGSLLELDFGDQAGFSCFAVSVRDGCNHEGDTHELTDEVLHALESILGCSLRVIWSGH
jgi:hypothetical protein